VFYEPVRPAWKGRVRCTVCGRTGYVGGTWKEACERGHLPCLDCGRQLSVKLDGTRRVHTRCPAKR
jgi:transcription elongation factor Elf1